MASGLVLPKSKNTKEVFNKNKMSEGGIEIWLHVILFTKKHQPLLHKDWRSKFAYYLKRTAKDNDIHIDYIGGVEDHLHLLLKLDHTLSPQKLINKIKRFAPDWFKENPVLQQKFYWEREHSIFSVSLTEIGQVRNYIKQQEYFHQEFPLSDELIILQKK